jgi:hypothetical protein
MEQSKALADAKLTVRNSGLYPRSWKDCGDGIYSAPVWHEATVEHWKARLWIVVKEGERTALIPGFSRKGVWLWASPSFLREGETGSIRSELAMKFRAVRTYLRLWQQTPVPEGAGEKIGAAVEKKMAPWYTGEVPHHGIKWQAREPFEYRGVTLLAAFNEVVEAEWVRRRKHGYTNQQSARVVTRFYNWFKMEWKIPRRLKDGLMKESQKVWFFGKKEKPKGRKRSIIGADIIAKLKAERKGVRDAKSNIR